MVKRHWLDGRTDEAECIVVAAETNDDCNFPPFAVHRFHSANSLCVSGRGCAYAVWCVVL